ncbi:MAG: tetratricopeptide repeat protein [Elusimicrobia bacterium]|nr:tetratricopeptide repeat protein [Elusimicrobiota bacterium]
MMRTSAARRPETAWEGWGVCYPPRCLWARLDGRIVRRAWAASVGAVPAERLGLYVHLPAEVLRLPLSGVPARARLYSACLGKEAGLLGLPGPAGFETVFIGSGGAGVLSSFPPLEASRLLALLRRVFRLGSLAQMTVELDSQGVSRDLVGALVGQGVDRVTLPLAPGQEPGEHARRLRRLAEACDLCRAGGVRSIDVDLASWAVRWKDAGSYERDAVFVSRLKTDSVELAGSAGPGGSRFDDPGAGNLQLRRASQRRGSVVGLGWGAVSRVRGRLVYAAGGDLVAYLKRLARGRRPPYEGCRVGQEQEMRAYVLGFLESEGGVDRSSFHDCFGVFPEQAFPEEFGRLVKEGRLVRRPPGPPKPFGPHPRDGGKRSLARRPRGPHRSFGPYPRDGGKRSFARREERFEVEDAGGAGLAACVLAFYGEKTLRRMERRLVARGRRTSSKAAWPKGARPSQAQDALLSPERAAREAGLLAERQGLEVLGLLADRRRDAGFLLDLAAAAAKADARGLALKCLALADERKDGPAAAARKASLLLELGRHGSAQGILERSTATSPADAGLWLDLAESAVGAGARGRALEAVKTAQGLEPDPRRKRRIASLYRALGDHPAALAVWKGLRLGPEDACSLVDLGVGAAAAGDRLSALEALGLAGGLGPPPALASRMASLYQQLGEARRAGTILDGLVRKDPSNGRYRSDRGVVKALLGLREEAAADYEAALALEPDFLPTYLSLAWLHLTRGDPREAARVYDRALARKPSAGDRALWETIRKERAKLPGFP